MKKVIIIGAGMAGLGAAWRLKKSRFAVEIYEKNSRPGGLCRTEMTNGYLFDYTGHLLHFRNEMFKNMIFRLLGDTLRKRKRSAWIYSKNVFTRYPFQTNLFGLPHEVIVQCIYEYSKQYFKNRSTPVRNYEEWIISNFGSGIAEHFMIPYNSKIYCRHPRELSEECTGRFVPESDLKKLVKGAISDNYIDSGYNSEFYYPEKGGIETVVKSLSDGIDVSLNESVIKIKPDERKIITSSRKEISYDILISTQPINELVSSIEAPIDKVRENAKKLKFVSVLNINLGIESKTGSKHWIYVPEKRYVFHRVGYTNNFSEFMTPPGCTSLYLEISYKPETGINTKDAIDKSIKDLIEIGLVKTSDEIKVKHIIDLPYAYVIYDKNRRNALDFIHKSLRKSGIISVGRFGSWKYLSMEDAFMEGWNAADYITNDNKS